MEPPMKEAPQVLDPHVFQNFWRGSIWFLVALNIAAFVFFLLSLWAPKIKAWRDRYTSKNEERRLERERLKAEAFAKIQASNAEAAAQSSTDDTSESDAAEASAANMGNDLKPPPPQDAPPPPPETDEDTALEEPTEVTAKTTAPEDEATEFAGGPTATPTTEEVVEEVVESPPPAEEAPVEDPFEAAESLASNLSGMDLSADTEAKSDAPTTDEAPATTAPTEIIADPQAPEEIQTESPQKAELDSLPDSAESGGNISEPNMTETNDKTEEGIKLSPELEEALDGPIEMTEELPIFDLSMIDEALEADEDNDNGGSKP